MLSETKAREIAERETKLLFRDIPSHNADEYFNHMIWLVNDISRSAEAESQAACVKLQRDCLADLELSDDLHEAKERLNLTLSALPTDALEEAVRKARLEEAEWWLGKTMREGTEPTVEMVQRLASLKGVS